MLHRIAGNKGASSAQSSLAMYSEGIFFFFSKVYKRLDDILTGGGAINEIKVLVLYSISYEFIFFISNFVESDDHADFPFLEDR